MELVTQQYEVRQQDRVSCLVMLSAYGYDIRNVADKPCLADPAYYLLWTDGSVTCGDTPLEIEELKAEGFNSKTFTNELS